MNCDDVFQHLTGVSSSEPMNGQLTRHLAGCPSCRDMAALFGPAARVLDRNSRDEESGDAPEPWQRVWEAVAVAERAAAQLKSRAVSSDSRNRGRQLLLSAALLLIGIAIGCVVGRGDVRTVIAGIAGDPPSIARSIPNPDGSVRASCERMVSFLNPGADGEFCPTCNRPFVSARANVCAICHINWPSNSVSDLRVNSSL